MNWARNSSETGEQRNWRTFKPESRIHSNMHERWVLVQVQHIFCPFLPGVWKTFCFGFCQVLEILAMTSPTSVVTWSAAISATWQGVITLKIFEISKFEAGTLGHWDTNLALAQTPHQKQNAWHLAQAQHSMRSWCTKNCSPSPRPASTTGTVTTNSRPASQRCLQQLSTTQILKSHEPLWVMLHILAARSSQHSSWKSPVNSRRSLSFVASKKPSMASFQPKIEKKNPGWTKSSPTNWSHIRNE